MAAAKEDHVMKMLGAFVVGTLFAVLLVTPVHAQSGGATSDPHHPAPAGGAATTAAPTPTPGPMGGGMPMEMCQQMMAAMMGMPMMGMSMMGGGSAADPKEKADMLQMRGEMMKAMGDIMMKHARRMQGAAKP